MIQFPHVISPILISTESISDGLIIPWQQKKNKRFSDFCFVLSFCFRYVLFSLPIFCLILQDAIHPSTCRGWGISCLYYVKVSVMRQSLLSLQSLQQVRHLLFLLLHNLLLINVFLNLYIGILFLNFFFEMIFLFLLVYIRQNLHLDFLIIVDKINFDFICSINVVKYILILQL